MSEHVTERIGDYLEGRLHPAAAREVAAHLSTCVECAADVRWARDFREAASIQGLRHPSPERIVEAADGRVPLTHAEERHVKSCSTCERELSWARGLPRADALGERTEPLDGASIRGEKPRVFPIPLRRGRTMWGLAALAAAATILIAIFNPGGQDGDLARLARIEPLPVHLTRGLADPGSFEEIRLRGLESYEARDYAGAREALRRAASMEPRQAEVVLYLGSATLLLGDAKEGFANLRHAAEIAEDPALREEALWQLANAALASGRAGDAEAALRDVIALERRHREDAAALLERLGDR